MTNPLLSFWQRLLADDAAQRRGERRGGRRLPFSPAARESTLFLVLRRMRAPLIGLIVIYAISVLGLTLIPGQDAEGRPWRMSFFHAFYFMSYTATTIGFGEIPHAFTDLQRMWVTFSIYLTVLGWAWAVGTLFALLQDRGFRRALALRRFARRVRRLREPFIIVAGCGQTGLRLVRALDGMGRRATVVDIEQDRVDDLALAPIAVDVPAFAADARVPDHLMIAGLSNAHCTAVAALTNDDEANLAVAMTAALLRPDVQVCARAVSPQIGERMLRFGRPAIVDPFDRFGDYLRAAIRSPASFRLVEWLTGPPGRALPRRREVPRGRWIVCGYGRFGQHVVNDLRAEGMDVTIVEPGVPAADDETIIVGYGTESAVLARADPASAAGFIAATDNDTANLSMIAAARDANADLFLIARQNDPANHALFRSIDLDFALIPSEVVAREVLARLTSPVFYRFLEALPHQDEAWATALTEQLVARCGDGRPLIWNVSLDARTAPAALRWLAEERPLDTRTLLGDAMSPGHPGRMVALMVLREGKAILAPGEGFELRIGDQLLLAGRGESPRLLAAALVDEAARDRAWLGIDRPAGWVWRRLARPVPVATAPDR